MNVRDSEFDRLLSDWLEDDVFVAPARPVEAAVGFARIHPRRRDRLAFLRRDVMTTRATTGLRPVAIVIAVALLLVLAIGGAVLIGSDPDTTPTPEPSTSASPDATPVSVRGLPVDITRDNTAPLTPGRYAGGLVAPGAPAVGSGPGDELEDPVDVEFTVGDGWSISQPQGGANCCWYLFGDSRSISYWPVSHVYPDACGTSTPEGPIWEGRLIGSTVDDLVAALDEQANTEMSEPIDVTIGGYSGKRFEMTASRELPDYCTDLLNVQLSLSLWPDLGGDRGRGVVIDGGPGEDTQPVYVIDVDGHRVVFVAWTTGVNPADAQAVDEVMQSMEFSVR